jgi:N-acetylglucosamine kinase-like BadF-type ATPase
MNGGEKILGVEGGGTKTAWVLVERAGNELCVLDQGKLPPANLRLATPGEFLANCRRKLRPPAFFWRAAGRKKIDNR